MFAGLPPSSSDLTERKSVVPPSPPADRRREHRESAAVVVARRGKNASARSIHIARSARCDVRLVAAVFVGSGRTEKRCSAISSYRSAARTSRIRHVVVARRGKNASARSISHCSLRSLRLALDSRCLPHSLAGLLARPGQRRASLAPCGGARFPTLAAVMEYHHDHGVRLERPEPQPAWAA